MNAEKTSSLTSNSTIEKQVPRPGGSSWWPVTRERGFRRTPADLSGSVLAPPNLEPLLIPDRGGASVFALLTPVDETPCDTDKNSNTEQQTISIRPLPTPESQTNRRRAHTWISQSSRPHMSAGPSIAPISNHSLTNKPGRSIPHSSAADAGRSAVTSLNTHSTETEQIAASGSNRSLDNNQRTLPIPPPPTTPPTHSPFKSYPRDQKEFPDAPDSSGSKLKPTYHKSPRQLVVVNPTEPGPPKASTRAGRRFSDVPAIKSLRSGGVSTPKIPERKSLPMAPSISVGERSSSRARAYTTTAYSHHASSGATSQQDTSSSSSQSRSQSSSRVQTAKGISSSEMLFGSKIKALPKVPVLFENKVIVPETVAVFHPHHGRTPSEDKSRGMRKGKEKVLEKEEQESSEELVSDEDWDVHALPLVNEHGQLSPPDSAKGGWSPNNVRGMGSRAIRPRGPRSRRSTIS